MSVLSQAWHVKCVVCRQDKWPQLPERPENYVCVLCRAEDAETRARRKEAAQRGVAAKKARRRTPTDATEGTP
jgi:hypothetical protein